VLWLKIGCLRPTCQASRPRLVAPQPFQHWILLLPTYFDTWWKWFLEIPCATLGRLDPGIMPRCPFMSYYPWIRLVLDIIKICMNFDPYVTFLSFDVPIIVDRQDSWNSLVISTYLLYLEWNIGMLVVNICILWPPTRPGMACAWGPGSHAQGYPKYWSSDQRVGVPG
jgi:hypothetical protein